MTKLSLLGIAIAAFVVVGCGSSSGTSTGDETKLHQDLSKPPSLAGMAKHPHGAHQKGGAGATATPGAAGGPTATGQ